MTEPLAPPASRLTPHASRYLYCVACASEEVALGAIGIEASEVYSVVRNDLCALVHDCPAHPYRADDAQVVAAWVLAHHRVVEAAWKRWGTVLPLRFNTIIEEDAKGNLRAWLETESPSLHAKLEAVAGKAEYGVQILWDTELMSQEVAATNPEIHQLREGLQSKPRGLAYMYRQRLERLLREEMEARAADEFGELYARLSRCVERTHVEKTKQGDEGPLFMNLSCLASGEQAAALQVELDEIGAAEGYSVRLAGPLPPYSFC